MNGTPKISCLLAASALALVTISSPAMARGQISIVGSSTVFPFAAAVAERFGKSTEFKTPVVEATGSGGGLKLFCSGIGLRFPDITNASRRIKASEVEKCAANGIKDIIEVKIGYDGVVFANSSVNAPINLSLRDIFLGLAKSVPDGEDKTKPNPYKSWSQVNPDFPDIRIEVLGPPPTSGTRDAFVELAMEGGCKSFDWIRAMKATDKPAYKTLCQAIREDGAYIEAGENDNLIVRKLEANPGAFGIFGFSFLEQNSDVVQGNTIDGKPPSFENIASSAYPISRSLYFYAKKSHLEIIPGIERYLAEFTSERAWGEEGYLVEKGLIPMTTEERKDWAARVKALQSFSM